MHFFLSVQHSHQNKPIYCLLGERKLSVYCNRTTLFVEWHILFHPTLNLPISTHLWSRLHSCRTSMSPVYLFLHRKATFLFLGTVNLLQHRWHLYHHFVYISYFHLQYVSQSDQTISLLLGFRNSVILLDYSFMVCVHQFKMEAPADLFIICKDCCYM